MKEINRQIVIFGNFRAIDFDIVSKISDIVKKYDLSLDAAPDYISNNGLNGIVQFNNINILQQLPLVASTSRPVLTTKDKKFSIFFGSKRLHIEENDESISSYETFLQKAEDIISSILTVYTDITINRLAINGKILLEEVDRMDEVYHNTFKPAEIYGDNSEEFSFRINTKIYSDALQSSINKIISYNRTSEILSNNTTKPIMIIDYDYNTVIDETKKYSFNGLRTLIKEGVESK